MENFTLFIKKYACGLYFFPCFLIAIFLSNHASGQSEAVTVIAEYGPKVGPNASIWRGDRPYTGMKKPSFGISFGGFASFRFAKFRYFQFEINALYTLRGNRCDFTNSQSGLAEQKSVSVHYGEIPILFKFMLNKGGMTRPYLFLGPTYSGSLRASFTIGGEKKDVSNDVNKNDVGLSIGGGLTWFYLDRWYFIDLRYYHGFINTSAFFTNNLDVFNPNWKNNPITSADENNGTIGNYFNSTISLNLAVSLSRKSSFNMR
jgi:hypothetical protein